MQPDQLIPLRQLIPAAHHDAVSAALSSVLDLDAAVGEPVTGGASGALVYRTTTEGRASLLRIETARDPMRDPHRTYPCLRAAADAGIAPSVTIADPDAGVVLMAFIEQRPLGDHPGGPVGVAREVGELIARLQRTPPAPPLTDFATLLGHMVGMLESSGLFAPAVLDPVRSSWAQLVEAYPWNHAPAVTSHNDINPFNVLSDGRRLWLIDWELSFRNDPLADVAGAGNNLTTSEQELDALLRGWCGGEPDRATLARLTLMRALNNLYYACLMLSLCVGQVPVATSLDAPTPDELRAEVEAGRAVASSVETLHTLGRMHLVGFVAAASAPETARAIIAAAG